MSLFDQVNLAEISHPDYPGATQPTVSVSAQTVTAGGSVTFSGSGFLPGETVKITVASGPVFLKSVVADSSGSFSTVVVLPAGITAGSHTLTATGLTSGRTASITIQVLGASANASTSTNGLAFTGAAIGGIAALGGLLLIGGGLMLLASKRRKVTD